MATKVTTLKNAEKTDNLLPRTELNAIFDSDGNYLDSNLKASDLNALKGGAVDELVRFTEDGAGTPIPTDADTLEGHDASYFATADALSSLIKTSNLTLTLSANDHGSYSLTSAEMPLDAIPLGVYIRGYSSSSLLDLTFSMIRGTNEWLVGYNNPTSLTSVNITIVYS